MSFVKDLIMKRIRLIPLSAICAIPAILVATLFVSPRPISANKPIPTPSPTPYNPYPSGILPPDLDTEILRVQREIMFIENEAMGEAAALPSPVLTSNPLTIHGSGYQTVEVLGKLLNFDLNMSPFRNEACSFCHMPYAGFSGPIPSVNLTMIAYPGTFHYRAGKRTAQRYTYSPDFPVLELDPSLVTTTPPAATLAAFFGGNFWDGRSTGYKLQSADSEQAQHPPVDTQEMGFPDIACIAFRISQAPYAALFEEVWGIGSLDIKFPNNTESICETPGGASIFGTSATPVELKPEDRTKANDVYDHWGQSISFYERSVRVSAFSSKFDAFLAGNYTMTADEMAGYNLFNGKGNCNSCHLDGLSTTLTAGQTDTGTPALTRPLFTCFGYANLGLPLNPRNAFYYQTTPDFYGFTPNPYGFGYRDLGFGTFLRSGFGSADNPNSEWTQFAPMADGQVQTATARDVGLTPPQCPTTEAPGPYFQKEFFHNGYIKSLKQLVHFYNTRDVFPFAVTSGNCPAGTTEKVTCWPEPEVPNNVDMTVGSLGLTDTEENQIVAFLQTLSDGFTTPYPDVGTFTGTCMTGGSAATQGNDMLIKAPMPLPPCAAAICNVAPTPGPSPIP
jgi:cytochrome c peroxidase